MIKLRRLLTGSVLITGALSGSGAALAQSNQPEPAPADTVAPTDQAVQLALPKPEFTLPKALASPQEPEPTEITAIQGRGTGCAGQGTDALPAHRNYARCAFEDIGNAFTLNLRQESDTVSLHAFGTFSRSASGIFTSRRQLYDYSPGLSRQASIGMLGLKADFLDRRLRLTVQQSRSEEWLTPVVGGSLARPLDQSSAGASLFKLDADVIKKPNLRWQFSAELSKVGRDFATSNVLFVPDLFVIPGDRIQISNRFKFGSTGLKLTWEDMQAYYGRYQSLRLGIDRNGVSLRLSRRESSSEFSSSFGSSVSRSQKLQAYLDIETLTLLPSLAGSNRGLGQLVPYTMSLGWDKSRTESGFAGINQTYTKRGLEFTGTWETRLGETSLTHRHDRRDQVAPIRGIRDYYSTDISHSIRRGPWRLGASLSIMRETRRDAQDFEEKMVSFGPSLAYSKRNGPEFSASIGRDNMVSSTPGGFYRSNLGSTAITARLDLTDFLRKRLNRTDLSLKIEYRKRVEATREEYRFFDDEPFEQFERSKREGLLLTFSSRM